MGCFRERFNMIINNLKINGMVVHKDIIRVIGPGQHTTYWKFETENSFIYATGDISFEVVKRKVKEMNEEEGEYETYDLQDF